MAARHGVMEWRRGDFGLWRRSRRGPSSSESLISASKASANATSSIRRAGGWAGRRGLLVRPETFNRVEPRLASPFDRSRLVPALASTASTSSLDACPLDVAARPPYRACPRRIPRGITAFHTHPLLAASKLSASSPLPPCLPGQLYINPPAALRMPELTAWRKLLPQSVSPRSRPATPSPCPLLYRSSRLRHTKRSRAPARATAGWRGSPKPSRRRSVSKA